MNEKSLLTMEQVAQLLNVKISWVRSMVFKGQLPVIRVGKHVRFCPNQIQAWVKAKITQENSWN